jgi:hypothetical protein
MRRLRDLAARIWYHRPVITTFARLEEIDVSATIRGIRWADENPKGKVVKEPRLRLVSSR